MRFLLFHDELREDLQLVHVELWLNHDLRWLSTAVCLLGVVRHLTGGGYLLRGLRIVTETQIRPLETFGSLAAARVK